jgi:hypothetical protein
VNEAWFSQQIKCGSWVLWVVPLCSLVGGYQFLEECTSYIFREPLKHGHQDYTRSQPRRPWSTVIVNVPCRFFLYHKTQLQLFAIYLTDGCHFFDSLLLFWNSAPRCNKVEAFSVTVSFVSYTIRIFFKNVLYFLGNPCIYNKVTQKMLTLIPDIN